MANELVFAASFDGLARALGPKLDRAALDRFHALGVDLKGTLLPAYPLDLWYRTMDLGSEVLEPGAPLEQRHRALGRQMLDGYSDTVIGRALTALLRVIGPRRTLERMTRNFRSTTNYTETRLEGLPDGSWRLWVSSVVSPHFYRGLLERAMELSGAKGSSVEISGHDASGAVFLIRWQ
jgi:uncharacterized protein (TIGR02265 family)